ncbi:MAG: sulfatase [Actinomycetota bacterium]|nr:sulfatase [Actinomycetota bacterium]
MTRSDKTQAMPTLGGPRPTRRQRAILGRSVIGAIVALGLVGAGLFWIDGTTSTSSAAPDRPNVLIIITDDQRGGLEVMEATRRFFKDEGTRFMKAFATTPSCCPSRASIFTGRYAHNHGVTNNENVTRLDHGRTLQRYLQEEGYTTAIFGKYLNEFKGERPPYFDSWSVSKGIPEKAYDGAVWNDHGELRKIDQYSTSYIADEAVDFVEEAEAADEDPWFMYLTPHAPHRPFVAEARYADAEVPNWKGNPAVFERDLSDKPPFVRDRHLPSRNGFVLRRRQLRTLMSVDDLVADVMERLRELDEQEDTLVIFMSDNGVHWAEHRLRNKLTPYTQSIVIPLFMRWPGKIEPGGNDERIAANIDIAPTVLDAVGMEQVEGMDGRSLLDTSWPRDRILTEFEKDGDLPYPTWASIRTRAYQYIEYYAADGNSVRFREYYDLLEDPWQLENLLGDGDPTNDPNTRRLSRQLAEDRACSEEACP